MKQEPLKCIDTTWLVSDSFERPLTDEEKEALAAHISECSLCQGASKQFEVLFAQLDIYFEKHNSDPSNEQLS